MVSFRRAVQISILKIVAFLGTLSGLGYYALCLWSSRWFFRRHGHATHKTVQHSVSILKPLCGADPHAYESLRSHCSQEYPDYEIIFGVSDPEDIAIPIVRRLIAEFPEREMQLVICPKFLGSNYKVSNLIQMSAKAKHEYVLVNDSDICVPPDYLERVINEFEDSRVGMVTCLYRGIGARTFGAKFEALGISTDFIPGVLSARQIEGGIHFGLGATLAFHRKALESIGGFECVADYLGDDYELGVRIAKAGYVVALSDCVVEHHLPDYSFRNYLQHQLRWARSTRNSRPKGYVGMALTFGFAWAVLGVIVAPSDAWAWFLLTAALALRLAVAFTVGVGILKDRELPGQSWLIPARDLIAVVIWLISFTGRRIVWRGNQFTLENGKLRL
jgi:ceramide glucosyltransferase